MSHTYLFTLSCCLSLFFSHHRCSSRITSMMQNIVVTCMGWALAQPMSRTAQGTLTKRNPTNSSHDITPKTVPSHHSTRTVSAALKPGFDDQMITMEGHTTCAHHLSSCFSYALLTIDNWMWWPTAVLTHALAGCVCLCVSEFSLLFLQSSAGSRQVGSVQFHMLEKMGILVFLKCCVENDFCTLKL